MTVTAPLRPPTRPNAQGRYSRNDGWCCDQRCYRVTAGPHERPEYDGLDGEDSWPADPRNTTTPSARTRTARSSRAASTRKARRRATGAATQTGKRPDTSRATRPALLAALPPLASHLPAWLVVLGVLALAAGYVLLVFARPTRACPRCHGERVTVTHWRHRIKPCRRCSATGRAPRFLAPAIHRQYHTIRNERTRTEGKSRP